LFNKILYYFFYVLFFKDTWRIIFGCLFAYLLAPKILKPELGEAGQILIWVMLMCIGWSLSGYPSRLITDFLKKIITRGPSHEK
jgi:hypothetical protein